MLLNINEILHPTDFSKPAKNAFTYTREIALKVNAKIVVMHSSKLPYAYGSEIKMQEAVYNDEYKDLHIEPTIEFGDTVSNILKFSGDLIVMGSTGKTNMGKVLFGSVSSEILLNSKIPVLIAPTDQPYSTFSHLIFATDYRERDLEILGELTTWAKLFDAEITVLHITPEDNLESSINFRGFKKLAEENIDNPEKINFKLIIDKDFTRGIFSSLNRKKGQLLVMTRTKKTLIQSLLNQDHIQQTVYSKVPLLVLPGEETLDKEK
ncbi:universal stress protein [Aliifodinibius salicampi]|uniref:Universal stress protein n=1 Tax=Fodinibius salicampi TaxID=1920655 RepID=A0ABT3PU94_9BACT|nr:universal stress protein [Fodinibius salicampi]MCW9711403.1 universal stress protein [Fodinibius salicampi]